jgi:hypothetical protein
MASARRLKRTFPKNALPRRVRQRQWNRLSPHRPGRNGRTIIEQGIGAFDTAKDAETPNVQIAIGLGRLFMVRRRRKL